jgi:ABC-2 type transport system permease protein
MNRGSAVLFIMTGLVGLLLAIGTILLFSFYPTEQTISKSILYVTFAIWTLGWIIGPMLTGGDGILRPEYFVLLPLNSYKLARMLLGVTFIGVGPLVSFLAFIGLLIYAARISIYATVVAVPAIILQLVFVVLLSKVIVSIMGEAMKSRVGMEMGAMFIGFIIAFLNVGWYALPVINRIIFNDTVLLYVMPSSWTILAVEYASQSNWLLTSVFLSAITILCGILLFIWTTLLTRSTVRDSKKIKSEITNKHYRKVFKIFFETKIGAIITKELKSWGKDPQRGRFLRMGIWIGVFYGIIVTIADIPYLMPWAGVIMIVFTSMFACNLYGFDGSALWLTLVTPGAERIDVRGRQLAWLIAIGPVAILTTIIFTFTSGLTYVYPWVFAVVPALLGGAVGLIVLFSIVNLIPITDPHRRGRGTIISGDDMNASKVFITTWFMLLMVLVTTIPSLLVVWLGTSLHIQFIQWLGVPTGVCTGVLLAWLFGRIAYKKLERNGPELLFEMKSGMKINNDNNKNKVRNKAIELPKKKLAVVVLLVFIGIFFLVHQSIVPIVFEIFDVDERVRLFFLPRYLPHIARIPVSIIFAVLGITFLYKAILIKKQHVKESQLIKDEM